MTVLVTGGEVKQISHTSLAGFPYPSTAVKDISKTGEETGYVPRWGMGRAILDYTDWLKKHQALSR